MKFVIKPIAVSLAMLGFASVAHASSVASLQSQIQKVGQQIQQLQAKHGKVQINPSSLNKILPGNSFVNTELIVLNARKNSEMATGVIYLGGKIKGNVYYQDNTSGTASPYTASKVEVNALQLSTVAGLNSWATLVSVVGSNSGTGLNSATNMKLDQGYVLLGNLNKYPGYVLVGRKNVDFGEFGRMGFLNKPLNRLAFEATANQAMVGYSHYGLNAAVSFFQGETQTSNTSFVLTGNDTSSRILTPSNSHQIGNFAVNASYEFGPANLNARFGLGYLNGSGFVSATNSETMPVLDVFADATFGKLKLHGEYDRTVSATGSTISAGGLIPVASAVTLNAVDKKVSAWNVAGAYGLGFFDYNSSISLSVSQLDAGNFNANQRLNQLALGYLVKFNPKFSTGLEYAYDGMKNGNTSYKTYEVALVATAFF